MDRDLAGRALQVAAGLSPDTRCSASCGGWHLPRARNARPQAWLPRDYGVRHLPFRFACWKRVEPPDFEDGISQRIGDLSDPTFCRGKVEILKGDGLIFVDGPKDRVFEKKITKLLYLLLKDSKTIAVWDNLKLMNMVDF